MRDYELVCLPQLCTPADSSVIPACFVVWVLSLLSQLHFESSCESEFYLFREPPEWLITFALPEGPRRRKGAAWCGQWGGGWSTAGACLWTAGL